MHQGQFVKEEVLEEAISVDDDTIHSWVQSLLHPQLGMFEVGLRKKCVSFCNLLSSRLDSKCACKGALWIVRQSERADVRGRQ